MASSTPYELPATFPLKGFWNGTKGFWNGTKILIKGIIHHAAQSFTVQFDCPEGIAFKMVADFTTRKVVCNSTLDGKPSIGEEHPMPQTYIRGEPMEMTITALSDYFDIDVKDKHKFTFDHVYKDLAQISPLKVKGDFSGGTVCVDDVVEVMASYKQLELPATVPLQGFRNGTKILIKGTIHHAAESFTVQFDCPEGIAFKMVADFTTREVVCNSTLDGKPSTGEVQAMPQSYIRGEPMEMTITALSDYFDIDVKDKHKFTFDYVYKDLAKISPLKVMGDFNDGTVCVAVVEVMAAYKPFDIPCNIPLKGMTNGGVIKMKATVNSAAVNFAVRLYCPNDGIALQMLADFDKDEVRCNSKLDGTWGHAEIHQMSFQQGKEFQLKIIFHGNLFTFLVNDRNPGFAYRYRYNDLAKINMLEVKGDLGSPVLIAVVQ